MREVERLSVEELCGQLLLVGFEGEQPPRAILDGIRERSLAGVVLFKRNLSSPFQALELCRELSRAAQTGYPIFVAVDQEGGRVQRLESGLLQLPPMRVLGEHDDVLLTEAVANELGRQLAALGFNLDFAPVADVDSNPRNPIIGDRSFGSDPALVVRHARAFACGLERQGVVACLKHFPGHGDTAVDSHLELPRVDKDISALRRLELYPFERVCRDAHAVMTAHVVFPAFAREPATLSPRLLSLLRTEFGFEGVVFSDDLEMKAPSAHWPIEDTAVRAVEAGCDVLLICSDPEQRFRAHRALVARAESDADFRERCAVAVGRSLRARQRFPQRPVPTTDALRRILESRNVKALVRALARIQRVG